MIDLRDFINIIIIVLVIILVLAHGYLVDRDKHEQRIKKLEEEKSMSNEGYEIQWDGPIEKDGPDFVTLPEGDYEFEVIEFERGRHAGSDKLPPCNKAVVHIRVKGTEGVTIIKHNLFLHSITEGMLCAFFAAIGQRKKGERVTMNWNAVVGGKGYCKVGIRKWKKDSGEEVSSNEIKKFYDPEEKVKTNKVGFVAGSF